SILLNHRRTMSMISFEIENATLIDGAKSRIFAGFQYMSKFVPQAKRYQKLAATAESVYVFGVHDIQPPMIPNINYIPLASTDRLASEWFVIAHSTTYSSALATEELSRFSDPDSQRQFKGIWTFDMAIVAIMHDWLASLVDARPLTDAEKAHDFAQQRALIGKSYERLNQKISPLLQTATTKREIAIAIQSSTPR
ncbi:MAG: DICT sensory domain-containing protein, partial [Chloroflexota bacterium]